MITDEEIRAWFKDHEAKYQKLLLPGMDSIVLEVLDWQSMYGNANYKVRYLYRGGSLIVIGDLESAIYELCGPFGRIATVDFDYFYRNCKASPRGTPFDDWSEERARKRLSECFSDKSSQFRFADIAANLHDEQDWLFWCNEFAYGVLGDNWRDWAPGIGRTPSLMCRAHYLGLKLAVQQLQEQGVLHAT